MTNNVTILFEGFSEVLSDTESRSNCTCTLVQTPQHKIIIDTMTPWDGPQILNKLQSMGISPDDITHVISTHGHSDHTGNNNLFLKAVHIVGRCISNHELYTTHKFTVPYEIGNDVDVIATAGHTLQCVSVIVRNSSYEGKTVAIVGDLFEKQEDINNKRVWMDAGTESEGAQVRNRFKIGNLADFIIPGHGPMFAVTDKIRKALRINENAQTHFESILRAYAAEHEEELGLLQAKPSSDSST